MTTEEKARKYDVALEKAKEEWKNNFDNAYKNYRERLEIIFPELRESNDERIRKEMQSVIEQLDKDTTICGKKYDYNQWIAWLEKKAEQEINDDDKAILENWESIVKENREKWQLSDWFVEATSLLIQKVKHTNTSKTDDKPKFHEGDWVLNDVCFPVQIASIKDGLYIFAEGDAISVSFVDENYHLWTIQDANDGDVLASELCDSIILFKGIENNNIQFYCDYDFSKIDIPGDRFAINNGQHYGSVDDSEDFHPATKEQYDTLMKAMEEAGYKWDTANKELKKMPEKKEYINIPQEKAYINVQHEFDKRFDKIVDKLTAIYGKLSDIYEVLTKPYMSQQPQMPTTNPIPGMDVWYKTHGVDKVPPVTCNLDQNANYTQTYSNYSILKECMDGNKIKN